MRFLFLCMFQISLAGCADPKYLSSSSQETVQNQEQKAGKCLVQFKNSGLCLDWKWEKFQEGEASYGVFLVKTYRLNKADASPILVDVPATPKIKLDMPGMPHGAPGVKVVQVDTGTYRASNVFFVMTGVWLFEFKIIVDGEVVDEVSFNVDITI